LGSDLHEKSLDLSNYEIFPHKILKSCTFKKSSILLVIIPLLNILKDFKVLSRFMQNWIQSSCLFGSRFACAQAAIFFAKPYSINAGEALIVLWVAAWIQHSAIQTKIERHFGGFFHQITVRQPIGRQDSMQPVIPNKQEVGFNFAWSGSEL
jgi:hypothetical protein